MQQSSKSPVQQSESFHEKASGCNGRACNKCGQCRDWYYNGDRWVLHEGATCDDGHGRVNEHGVWILDFCEC
ncbi:unnamed protein product [Adineta ricciae]|uniref:Uncharacterized protein n=1 Tax=Adineta ricciae TaxID=249248 RepID=A0A815L6J0_ADIRI|nr:unnamed protein product [Adineta ricciae]CAF1399302.1 unnamed protein product [Adineta ricciae]